MPMPDSKKSKKTKYFRVCTEGATTDGRHVERRWIEQMAKNYRPEKYGARVNMEHFHGIDPDGLFKRYGDVLELKTEQVEDGKLALFASIDPTEELIALNKRRQKMYTSVEIDDNFADTGEAYLVGLAITDNPACLGVEMLQFSASAKQNPLAHRKQQPGNLFTETIPFNLELDTETEKAIQPEQGSVLMIALREILGINKPGNVTASQQPVPSDQTAVTPALATAQPDTAILHRLSTQEAATASQSAALIVLAENQQQTADKLDKLITTLSQTDASTASRPPASGASVDTITDC